MQLQRGIRSYGQRYLFFVLFFYAFNILNASEEKSKVVILESQEIYRFEKDKSGNVKCKISYKNVYKSLSSVPQTVGRVIFYDNNSKVSKITEKSRGSRKIKPIITNYEFDGNFHSDIMTCLYELEFEKKNQVIEVKYEIEVYDVRFLNPIYFNDQLSIEHKIVTIREPSWLSLDLRLWNEENASISYQMDKKKKENAHTYELHDVDAYSNHSNELSRSHLYPHLILVPLQVNQGGQTRSILSHTSDLYAWYTHLVGNINNDTSSLRALVDELVEGKQDTIERIESIYYWIQDNIRYLAFEYGIMGFQPENCQTVLENKFGDCKGMANLLKQMLIMAGYDARLCWLGTNELPYNYDLPSLIVDNHMICAVHLDSTFILLDATSKYANIYEYGYGICDKQVMIEDGDTYIIEHVPEFNLHSNAFHTSSELQIIENNISGKGVNEYIGQDRSNALYLISQFAERDHKEVVEEIFSKGNSNIIYDVKLPKDEKKRNAKLEIPFTLQMKNKIIDLGSELYINLEYEYIWNDLKIESDRKTPLNLVEPLNYSASISLAIPDGWEVKYVPDSYETKNEFYQISAKYLVKSNHLFYLKEIQLENPVIPTEHLQNLNEDVQNLRSFYDDQIILTKK